jgi:hypothetical protein
METLTTLDAVGRTTRQMFLGIFLYLEFRVQPSRKSGLRWIDALKA